jgi:hypothetical protein
MESSVRSRIVEVDDSGSARENDFRLTICLVSRGHNRWLMPGCRCGGYCWSEMHSPSDDSVVRAERGIGEAVLAERLVASLKPRYSFFRACLTPPVGRLMARHEPSASRRLKIHRRQHRHKPTGAEIRPQILGAKRERQGAKRPRNRDKGR